MPHLTYPSHAQLARESAAEERDLCDLLNLRRARVALAEALIRLSAIDELRHPERRWSFSEAVDTLQGEIFNLDETADFIRNSPLLIEEDA